MAEAPNTGGMGRKEGDDIWKEAGHEGPGKLLRGNKIYLTILKQR